MKTYNFLSIVIPVRESQNTIRKTLESLFSQSRKPDEVILVSNKDDGTKSAILDYINSQKINYIELENLDGFTRDAHLKRWVGANNAKGDLIFFTDSKVLLDQDALQQALVLLSKNHVEALAASVYSWPEDAHKFIAKTQDKGLIRNNPVFPPQYFLTEQNFGKTESLPVTTGLLITKKAFDIIKNDFGLEYSKVSSSYDDYITSWLLVKNGITILLTNKVKTYHKHRLSWEEYFKQISRSGQSAAVMSGYYPDCPFGKRRHRQVLSIFILSLIIILLATISLWLRVFLQLFVLPVFLMFIILGIINALREKDKACFFIPPITILLVLQFSYHYFRWITPIRNKKSFNAKDYLQL